MSSDQHNNRSVDHACVLCGAPAGMTCSEYTYIQHINRAFDMVEAACATSREPSTSARMDRIGVPEVTAS